MAPPLDLEAVEGRDSWGVYTLEGGVSAKNICRLGSGRAAMMKPIVHP
jgi:hypothetical protein